jgi:hypothetical protein
MTGDKQEIKVSSGVYVAVQLALGWLHWDQQKTGLTDEWSWKSPPPPPQAQERLHGQASRRFTDQHSVRASVP